MMSIRLASAALAALTFCLSVQAAELTDAEFKRIVDQPHSDVPPDKDIAIFPRAREYQITMKSTEPDGQTSTTAVTGYEKRIDGRFIVSSATLPGSGQPFQIVVHYDADDSVYRKYVLFPDGVRMNYVGLRVAETRSVVYSAASTDGEMTTVILSTETHTDDTSQWSEVATLNGRVIYRSTGHANVTVAE